VTPTFGDSTPDDALRGREGPFPPLVEGPSHCNVVGGAFRSAGQLGGPTERAFVPRNDGLPTGAQRLSSRDVDVGGLTLGDRDRLDTALAGAMVIGVIGTLVVLAIPNFHGHVVAPAADLTFDVIALAVTTAVAALSWIRYRESRQPMAHAQAAAFLALAIADGLAVAVSVSGDFRSTPVPAAMSEDALFVWTAARLLAASILVVAGLESLRGGGPPYPVAFVLVIGAFMLLVIGAVLVVGDRLTTLLAFPVPDDRPAEPQDLALTAIGVVVHVVGTLLFVGAAAVSRRLWRRDRAVGEAYLALGLLVAAFAQLHAAFFPSAHPEQLGTADLLRLAFYVILFLGIQAETGAVMKALRTANESLAHLRDAEVDRAALEERARLSRELHDGLAQDLWLAKLKIGRLAASTSLSPEDRTLAEEATKAVDVGLTEARQGVMALRDSADPSQSFAVLLRRYVEDFVDRFGVEVEFECAGSLPDLSSRTKADLLRIVQEALSNATRHSSAESFRVQVSTHGGDTSIVVQDDGRGFDPEARAPGHVGLQVMRERAAAIGAQLTVESSPRGGTRVVVTVPGTADRAVEGAAP
jgi:signal transduction histidine kinase